ncbi:hypothetical protein RvY_13273 [Ramazzottius varieornatus]|uniref:Uncharacterized protein n=1 Tax=Ramazzottius varieornatus TaxID=947166 RepID=A0A1D1VPI8_RAMVA|nr:hypothetical protein RvY_13273 [Ramazzottius varieornatus]
MFVRRGLSSTFLCAVVLIGLWMEAQAQSPILPTATPVAPVPVRPHKDLQSLSPGSIILLVTFSGLLVYFLGGMLIRRFIGGVRGNEVIPHYDFWTDLPLLIKDGAMFLFSGCRPEVVYERI